MTTIHREPAPGSAISSLAEDARRMAEAVGQLLPVLEFRDRDRVAPYGVSASQWCVLRAVTAAGALTVNELAAAVYLDKSTVSRIATGLVDRELLARKVRLGDARAVQLVATAGGRALCATIQADEERDYATLLADLDLETRAVVHRALTFLGERIAAGIETEGGSCWVVE